MGYGKINIIKFEGLNNAMAAELIPDGYSRDIVNLRLDKIGKLGTRNGYLYGLLKRAPQATTSDNIKKTVDTYIFNCGIVGIGEISLSHRWEAFDTDRFMVYALRGLEIGEPAELYTEDVRPTPTSLEDTQNNYLAFLFSPLSGKYKNQVLYYSQTSKHTPVSDTMNVFDGVDAEPKGKNEILNQLYAPNRNLPGYVDIDKSVLPTYAVKAPALHHDESYIVTSDTLVIQRNAHHITALNSVITFTGGSPLVAVQDFVGITQGMNITFYSSGTLPPEINDVDTYIVNSIVGTSVEVDNGFGSPITFSTAGTGEVKMYWSIIEVNPSQQETYTKGETFLGGIDDEVLSGTYTKTVTEDYWNYQYIQMKQYRDRLIISDRINGDMVLENEKEVDTLNVYEDRADQFHLRPNTIQTFDINTVKVTNRTVTGQENDATTGVESGMGLYQYALPKKVCKVSDDNYKGALGDSANYPTDETPQEIDALRNKIKNKISNDNFDTLFSFMQFFPRESFQINNLISYVPAYSYDYASQFDSNMTINVPPYYPCSAYCYVKTDYDYIFSNAEEATEYDDVLGKLEFKKEKYTNTDGKLESDIAPDIYIWDDFKQQYFLCSGKNYSETNYYLTELDRFFTKLTPNAPRVTKLVVKTNRGNEVPLGVWKYRFVWDFGEGDYSAPSADIAAPDQLWSMTKDDELCTSGSESTTYHRPKYNELTDLESQVFEPISPYVNNGLNIWVPPKLLLPSYYSKEAVSVEVLSGTANGAVFTTNNSLTDTRLSMTVNDYIGTILVCEGQEANVLSNTADTFTVDSWTGGTNPGGGHGWHCWEDNYILTNFGRHFAELKLKLYENNNHRFGGKLHVIDDYDLITTSLLEKSDIMVQATMFFSSTNLELKGFVWEGAGVAYNDGVSGDKKWKDSWIADLSSDSIYRTIDKHIIYGFGKIVVPIFQSIKDITQNSLFDDEGRLRLLYRDYYGHGYSREVISQLTSNYMTINYNCKNIRLVFEKHHIGVGSQIYNIALADNFNDNTTPNVWYPYFPQIVGGNKVNNYLNNDDSIIEGLQYYNVLTANYSGDSSDIYINIISIPEDTNNNVDTDDYVGTFTGVQLNKIRPFEIIRGIKNESDKLNSVVSSDIPQEVINRLILNGCCEIPIVQNGSKIDFDSSSIQSVGASYEYVERLDRGDGRINDITHYSSLHRNLREGIAVYSNYAVQGDDTARMIAIKKYDAVDNVDITVFSTDAQRFTGTEQITAYFPSSLLFGAPRLGIQIGDTDVPRRAKKLLIYRTKCSHANDFDPHEYGLVASVDIRRYNIGKDDPEFLQQAGLPDGDPNKFYGGEAFYCDKDNPTDWGHYHKGFYYFDQIKDNALDFGYNSNETDALRVALKSRFNLSLYEIIFYANLLQTWQPLQPKENYGFTGDNPVGIVPSTSCIVLDSNNDKGYNWDDEYINILYKYIYEDVNGVLSEVARNFTPSIIPSNTSGHASVANGSSYKDMGLPLVSILYLMPSSYTDYVERIQVYRNINSYAGIDISVKSDTPATIPQEILKYRVTKGSVIYNGSPYGENSTNGNIFTSDGYSDQVTTEVVSPDEATIRLCGSRNDDDKYYYIGEIKDLNPSNQTQYNEGVFVDDYLPSGKLLEEPVPKITDYKSGICASDPMKPDVIRLENIWEVGSGDGDEITGMEIQYGNILVFKSHSLYRLLIKQDSPIIERMDKISDNVGCIAPNTLINIDNVLYFLSWKGLMKFDGNSLEAADQLFNEELQFVLNVNSDSIRDASCGYNQYYDELYLNVPAIIDLQEEYGKQRVMNGNIYVVGLNKKYATKFEYPKNPAKHDGDTKLSEISEGRQMVRLYYTNSLGEMRSADVLPVTYHLPDPINPELSES